MDCHITISKFGQQKKSQVRTLSSVQRLTFSALQQLYIMVNKAKSIALKAKINREEVDGIKLYAKKVYLMELERSLELGEKRKSSRQVCEEVSDAHLASTGHRIKLHHWTLLRHANGGVTLTESNGKKGWLKEDKEDRLVKFTVELA